LYVQEVFRKTESHNATAPEHTGSERFREKVNGGRLASGHWNNSSRADPTNPRH
jgi:hypothetical protein